MPPAQQIVHGEACYDTLGARTRAASPNTATSSSAPLKAIEDYQNEFRSHFPNEHCPAGRYAKTTPLTLSWKPRAQNSRSSMAGSGWSTRPRLIFYVTHGFRFDEAHDIAAAEVAAVQNGVGLTEVNGFNRMVRVATRAVSSTA